MTTHQHIIDRGPYKGMVETLTNNPHPAKTARCYMCAEPLKASSSWLSLVGDHQDGVFCARYLCQQCARERLNGIPDDAERCWNYTQAANSKEDFWNKMNKLSSNILRFWFLFVLVATGGLILFLFFLLFKNLFN